MPTPGMGEREAQSQRVPRCHFLGVCWGVTLEASQEPHLAAVCFIAGAPVASEPAAAPCALLADLRQ